MIKVYSVFFLNIHRFTSAHILTTNRIRAPSQAVIKHSELTAIDQVTWIHITPTNPLNALYAEFSSKLEALVEFTKNLIKSQTLTPSA